ncbi:hypothetical protein GQ54DRAFT_40073 [Martensiomyces pterosporus]|nr:hypothetical protein GQ54DRAFT_40073 [Martensiomyces pterosporus]
MSLLNRTATRILPRIGLHAARYASILSTRLPTKNSGPTASDGGITQYGYPIALSKGEPEVMDELQYILKDAGTNEVAPPKSPAEETEELLNDLQNAVRLASSMVDSLAQASEAVVDGMSANEDDGRLTVQNVLSVRADKRGGRTIELEISPQDLHRFLTVLPGRSAPTFSQQKSPMGQRVLSSSACASPMSKERSFGRQQRTLRCGDCRFASTCSYTSSFTATWSIDGHCPVGDAANNKTSNSSLTSAILSRLIDGRQSAGAVGDGGYAKWAATVATLLGMGTLVELLTGSRLNEVDLSVGLGKLPSTQISNIMCCL